MYDKWSKGDKKGSEAGEEPAWVEVLTEILISLLAQNNHLLRGVVGAVFIVVGREITAPAMDSLQAVVKQKYGEDEGEDDEDDEEIDDEDDEDEGQEENGNEKESSEEEDSSDDEEEQKNIDPALLTKLSGALGDHAADSEDDIDMDEVPDEDMAKFVQPRQHALQAEGVGAGGAVPDPLPQHCPPPHHCPHLARIPGQGFEVWQRPGAPGQEAGLCFGQVGECQNKG